MKLSAISYQLYKRLSAIRYPLFVGGDRALMLRAVISAGMLFFASACVPAARASLDTPAPVTKRALVRSIDSLVRQPDFRNAHWGILIVDPVRRDTLYSWNAGKLFMPASNMKLITGAVALATLGPDFRFTTTFLARGTRRDSVLAGDLIVEGRGDPTISEGMRDGDAMAPLLAIADSLAARGIRRITGQVLPGSNVFSDAPHGFGWSWDDFDYDYSAGVDELFINEGFARVVVRAGAAPGDAPTAQTFPARAYPPLRIDAKTVEKTDSARRRLTWETQGLGPLVVIGGVIPVGDSGVINVSYRDQRAAFLAVFAEALQARGITVVGGTATDTLLSMDTLFTVTSPTLAEILPRFEKPSQNQIGEILLKTMGLVVTGAGTADSGRRVVERQLAAWGADTAQFVIRDGSGLSRHNYVSPATLIRVLDAMRQSPYYQTFYHSLPIAGVDGTIERRMRGTPAEGNVRAKTGTIDKARSLSGYVTTADGELLLFSLLCNNYTVPTSWPTRVQDSIAADLAALRLRSR